MGGDGNVFVNRDRCDFIIYVGKAFCLFFAERPGGRPLRQLVGGKSYLCLDFRHRNLIMYIIFIFLGVVIGFYTGRLYDFHRFVDGIRKNLYILYIYNSFLFMFWGRGKQAVYISVSGRNI